MALDSLKRGPPSYDLWDESGLNEEKAKKIALKRQKKDPHIEKAVKLPHPGQSYNPEPEAHRKLLASVAEEEVKYLKKGDNLNKEFMSKVTAEELDHDRHQELVSGIEHLIAKPSPDDIGDKVSSLVDDDASDQFNSDYDEADYDAMLKERTVQEKRKTNAQRMRQLRDKLQRKQAKLRKIRNIRLNKFNHLKKIKKSLDEQDRLRQLKKKRSTKRRAQRFTQKFERSDPIFCLPSELPSNLRLIKCPADALLRERMESFQARNLVEPTSKQMPRVRYAKKKFERRDANNKISDDLHFESEAEK